MTSTPATANLNEIAAFWRTSRRLYELYSELKRTFELDSPLCTELEYPVDRAEPEAIARVKQWFDQMDSRIQVWQLRQLLQSTNLQTEENLRELIHRHLDKKQGAEIDRDKVDFLLVQYYAHCAPHGLYDQQITPEEVGRVLEPVLGKAPEGFPEWVGGLDVKLDTLNQCNSLEQLQNSGALLEVRELKLALADHYPDIACLVAFTRFNFLARRAFFRAMHLDLHAIRNAINELESRGVTNIDCSEAGMTEREGLETIRHLVHQWKTPFRAPYSGGSSFLQLILLRHVLQRELDGSANKAVPAGEAKAETPTQEKQQPVAQSKAEPALQPEAVSAPVAQPPAAPKAENTPQEFEVSAAPSFALPVKEADAAPEPLPRLTEMQAPQERARVEDDGYLEQCIADINQQLLNLPKRQGASVTPISLGGCRLMIAAWEAEAFIKTGSPFQHGLQRAVSARTILHVCVERHKKHEPTDLFAALEIAHIAAHEMRQEVARAKNEKNIDAAVNLAASAKRLLALIEQAEQLLK
jgi:hypothetical protein